MQLAQQLYEGIQLSDDKATGLITYIRTDGLHVSTSLPAFFSVWPSLIYSGKEKTLCCILQSANT